MQTFLAVYQRVVLAERFPVLLRAYRRAKGEAEPARDDHDRNAELQALRVEHHALLERVVIPIATQRVAGVLYTDAHLYALLQLFRDAERRFREPAPAPLHAQAKSANEVAWREIRGLLLADDWTAAYCDASLPPEKFWGPLLSHLAREVILWAYAARAAGTLDATAGGAAAAPSADAGALEPGWSMLMGVMMTRLEVDLAMSLPGRHDGRVRADASWDDAHGEGGVEAAPSTGPDADTVSSSLGEIVVTDPFESTFDFKDAERVRHVVVDAHARESEANERIGRTLRGFDFSSRLLLRFAYTAQTHLALGTPAGELPAVRAALVEGLLQMGFQRRGDPDCGDALGWLADVTDAGQHFGAAFDRHLNTVTAEAMHSFPDDQAEPLLVAFKSAVSDCVERGPHLTTSLWLGRVDVDRIAPARLLAHVSAADWAAALTARIRADLATLLERHGDPLAKPGRVVFGDLDLAGDRAAYALLTELHQSYSDLCAYARLSDRAPRRVRKFFTTLCRGERMGEEANDVLGVAEWTLATETLCAEAQGFVVRYRNAWTRLRRRPRATGRAVSYLEALRTLLAPLPGLAAPSDTDHA